MFFKWEHPQLLFNCTVENSVSQTSCDIIPAIKLSKWLQLLVDIAEMLSDAPCLFVLTSLYLSPFKRKALWLKQYTLMKSGRSPCKTEESGRAEIHLLLDLHQICHHAKMSVTDSLLKLMSWLHRPCCPPLDRRAIKYSDLLSFNVTTMKWWIGLNILPFKSHF